MGVGALPLKIFSTPIPTVNYASYFSEGTEQPK